jgi:hypothetical protein
MTTLDLPKPETALVEKAPESSFGISEERMLEIQKKAAEIAARLTPEELQECNNAVSEIRDIYPMLHLGSEFLTEAPYEARRENFKPIIDRLEKALVDLDKYSPEEFPTIHKFTPGMYIREIHVPAGSIFTSVTHKTQHPFVLSKGVCDICNEVGEVSRYAAPHTGITQPETRRVFLVHSDIVFTTFHVTDITDPDEWIRQHTACENETLPEDTTFKCFSRKELKWRA